MATNTHWLNDPMAVDIHEYLRNKESDLPLYHAQSPQLSNRRYLVDWLAIIADKFDLCACSKHLCIALLDYFMDQYCITDSQLKLVVLGCLLIACKMEEQEINIPKSNTLNTYVTSPGYSSREYLNIELMLLQSFAWRLDFPTAAHFIEYYLFSAVNSSDLHHDKPLQSKCSTARVYVRRYCTYFLEVSLQDHLYRRFAPSLVASSCIMSSRICLGISPMWTPQLMEITRYKSADLSQTVAAMLRAHKMDSEENSPRSNASTPSSEVMSPSTDHGYESLLHTPNSTSPRTSSTHPSNQPSTSDVGSSNQYSVHSSIHVNTSNMYSSNQASGSSIHSSIQVSSASIQPSGVVNTCATKPGEISYTVSDSNQNSVVITIC